MKSFLYLLGLVAVAKEPHRPSVQNFHSTSILEHQEPSIIAEVQIDPTQLRSYTLHQDIDGVYTIEGFVGDRPERVPLILDTAAKMTAIHYSVN